jgi:putative tricarboxylic transport membrane protein
MRAADLTTALVLIAGGALVIWDSLRIGIGWGTDGPRSGFFPFWLAVLMVGACLGIMARAVANKTGKPFVTRERLRPVLDVLWPATATVLLMHWIGLYVASALYMGFYMRRFGRYGWPAVLVVSIGFVVIVFVIFEIWFLVPMPKGPVEAYLGY